MPTSITRRLLACILGFAVGSLAAVAGPAQTGDWDGFMAAGLKAAAASRVHVWASFPHAW